MKLPNSQTESVLKTGVKSDLAFCLGSLIEKTNSEWAYLLFLQTDGVIPLEVPGPRVKMQLPLLQVQVLGVKNFTVHDFSTGRGGQEVVDFRMKVDDVERMSAR